MTGRTKKYEKNRELEQHIASLNALLGRPESEATAEFDKPNLPLILILGCARSGTTLLLQWLHSLRMFWVPSNFVSRFYAAPLIGFRIQKLLTDPSLSFGAEMSGFTRGYESDLGKTKGWLSPSEFWYFWRQYFEFGASSVTEISGGMPRFLQELAALEFESGKPLALKAMIANQYVEPLNSALQSLLFIHVVRDPMFNAQSILEARQKHTGSIDNWWSFELPDQEAIAKLQPEEQVVTQVLETNHLVEHQLESVDDTRKLTVEYEQLCENPEGVFAAIREKLNHQHVGLVDAAYPGPGSFESSNERRIGQQAWNKLSQARISWLDGELGS